MNYSDYKDIYEFYAKTGMNREQAYDFLLNELKKLKGEGNDESDN